MLFDMNILHLSDTHGAHRSLGSLPEADVIVHSGDIAMNGSSSEVLDFMRWFSALPYAHKIFVAGNHDACLYGAVIDGLDSNCHYLCNSSVEIDGVTFYGVPMFMEDVDSPAASSPSMSLMKCLMINSGQQWTDVSNGIWGKEQISEHCGDIKSLLELRESILR